MQSNKETIRAHFDRLGPDMARWQRRNRYYHRDQQRYIAYLVEPGRRVLELGCGGGDVLAACRPAQGVGVDFCESVLAQARAAHPGLTFIQADAEQLGELPHANYDYIILSDLVGYLDDIQACLQQLRRYCHGQTRLVVNCHNFAWQPMLVAGEKLGLKMPTPAQSWISMDDLRNLLYLADFQVVKTERRLLFPKFFPLLSWLFNHLGNLPLINHLCLAQYVVARWCPAAPERPLSTTILIPCRNERGNIRDAVARLPEFGGAQEILFVDGHSDDGTQDEIRAVIAAHPDKDIRLIEQVGRGKGDAVRLGFSQAKGEVLMILDADLTVPPEELPKFHRALAAGKADFVNGSRLVYPMESEAMRLLNLFANKFFALAFSWLLGQRLKDTLCGSKVILREHYQAIARNRAYFGDFDPFGDFDLLFGASKLNLKIVEVPVRYRNRNYGETKISRFRHGWLLLRMVVYAYRKLKSI
jgi:SAM-dependent methyltransferase